MNDARVAGPTFPQTTTSWWTEKRGDNDISPIPRNTLIAPTYWKIWRIFVMMRLTCLDSDTFSGRPTKIKQSKRHSAEIKENNGLSTSPTTQFLSNFFKLANPRGSHTDEFMVFRIASPLRVKDESESLLLKATRQLPVGHLDGFA